MLVNALSSTRFAPHPAITRAARTTVPPAHQQREGVTIAPKDARRLNTTIDTMFLKATNNIVFTVCGWGPLDNSEANCLLQNTITALRSAWDGFLGGKDGFKLAEIIPDENEGDYRLIVQRTLNNRQIPPMSSSIANIPRELLGLMEDPKSRVITLSTNGNKVELVIPFSTTLIGETIDHLNNTGTILERLNSNASN